MSLTGAADARFHIARGRRVFTLGAAGNAMCQSSAFCLRNRSSLP
ncbi:hypothetical protein BCO71033_03685 [Burkholderia contaminans]|uniref:Uncharacterized protein n=1 Tax=Burkholderia contaminans TaxID=488447 RepID=A0A6P2Z243_9BURK|nr:hypothetical protein BCO71033_03685 [Burkholderia contaminans]